MTNKSISKQQENLPKSECKACKAKQACIDSLLDTIHEAPNAEWKKDAVFRAIKDMNHANDL